MYNCLIFGVLAAPTYTIFQKTLQTLLHGITNVCVYVSRQYTGNGKTSKEHFENLVELLIRLYVIAMRFKEQKCTFTARSQMVRSLNYS